jgi:putative ABC transport system permease protein
MSLWSELKARWDAIRSGREADRETAEEIGFHLDQQAETYRRAGHSPEAARRLARVAFGGVTQTQEEVREARGARVIDDLVWDGRQAVRQLGRSPGFATVAVLTLALGIGANTAIYSVVDGVLLRPSPLADPDRLVVLWETDRNSGTLREPAAWPDYLDFQRRSRTVARLAATMGTQVSLTPADGDPVRVSGVAVTHGYLDLVGVKPLVGRGFTEEEDRPGGPPVALLGEALWRSRFRGDPAVVGATVRANERSFVIQGVLPRGADFGLDQINARAAYRADYSSDGEVGIWFPLQADEQALTRDTHPLLLVGRLGGDHRVATAQQELAGIAAELETAYPGSNRGRGVTVEPLDQVVFGAVRPMLRLLIAAVVLVLLVACVNVANLLLARGTARAREVAVRGALGADLGRLGRQFVTEALLLSLLGAAGGIALAHGGLAALIALAPADIPRLAEVGIDERVLGFTVLVSLIVGVSFGLVPTFQAVRLDIVRTIRGEAPNLSGGPGGSRVRQLLVVTELALSVMLVISAGLLLRSFRTVLDVDPGFTTERILKAEYQLPPARYPRDFSKWPNWTEIQGFHASLLERVRRVPGVESAAVAGVHPLDPGFTNSFGIVGRDAEGADWPEISVRVVSPNYVETMGLSLQDGRTLQATDEASSPPVALINRRSVELFFKDRDPLGQEIRFWGSNRRIVGVVGNERVRGLTEAAPPAVYIPLTQAPSSTGVLLIRAAGDPRALATAARQVIRDGDKQLAVFGVEPLAETLSDSIGQRRFSMVVIGSFAVIALALALIGVYGMLSYTTAQRSRELGIRSALGATRRSVTTLVVRNGLTLAGAGVAVGLIGALVLGRLLSSLLFGVSPVDPVTYVVVVAAVLGATGLATWLPARRAARVAPVEALRLE